MPSAGREIRYTNVGLSLPICGSTPPLQTAVAVAVSWSFGIGDIAEIQFRRHFPQLVFIRQTAGPSPDDAGRFAGKRGFPQANSPAPAEANRPPHSSGDTYRSADDTTLKLW